MHGGHHGRVLKLSDVLESCIGRGRFFEAGSASRGCQAMASLRGRAIAERPQTVEPKRMNNLDRHSQHGTLCQTISSSCPVHTKCVVGI